MKIVELEIKEVRGIRHILLKPSGKNVVISGPNGSGKSGVVDAIDFLLTGSIQRLRGKGTGDLSLKKHGVHIGADPKDTTVRAVVELPSGKRCEISRSIASPGKISCDGSTRAELAPILELAARGQHILSRREILRFVTAEPGDRAEEIQALLNLREVEATRQALVKARTAASGEAERCKTALRENEARIAAAAQIPDFTETGLVDVVNAQRQVLQGQPFTEPKLTGLKADLRVPAPTGPPKANATLILRDVDRVVHSLDSERSAERLKLAERFSMAVVELCANKEGLAIAKQTKLLELGYSLLDGAEACPLCDTPWPDGRLSAHVAAKLEKTRRVHDAWHSIADMAAPFLSQIRTMVAVAEKLADAAKSLPRPGTEEVLQEWIRELNKLQAFLAGPVDIANSSKITPEALARLGAPDKLQERLARMRAEAAGSSQSVSLQQTAWDLLTSIEEHTKTLQECRNVAARASNAAERMLKLYDAFESARDRELQCLYDTIRARFVQLYKKIHSADEDGFEAILQPDGAGLRFEVDFYGTGTHPPHALHSEGHQDSMGLCLYLALAEHLNRGVIDLVVLDDVVMSVDSGHRREVCRVLAEEFRNQQFLITTHERAWAGQLRTEGVVTTRNSVSFYSWSLNAGPSLDQGGDMWASVTAHLTRDDIPQAAHALRYDRATGFL